MCWPCLGRRTKRRNDSRRVCFGHYSPASGETFYFPDCPTCTIRHHENGDELSYALTWYHQMRQQRMVAELSEPPPPPYADLPNMDYSTHSST